VSGRLGHANAATTLNVYSAFLQASDHDAAELLGQMLSSAQKSRRKATSTGSGVTSTGSTAGR
jgi:hypothetical protein